MPAAGPDDSAEVAWAKAREKGVTPHRSGETPQGGGRADEHKGSHERTGPYERDGLSSATMDGYGGR